MFCNTICSVVVNKHWQLYLIILLPLTYVIVFKYIPMLGIQIAFKDYNFQKGIWGSPWVGLKHFKNFISSYEFPRLLKNTIGLSLYNLIVGSILPIILAIDLNYARSKHVGKVVQMVTYMPHFISNIIVVSILFQVLSANGIVNSLLNYFFGTSPIYFMNKAEWFKSLYVWSGVWQGTGYGAVIYLAALAGVNQELYEAATVDGASIWQRIVHIDIPSIMPTAIILLIMGTGQILNLGFEKVYLMQNSQNMATSDIIATYVYRIGLISMQYSYSSAIGLFQSLVSLILITGVNFVSNKVTETSLW
jgi:putative aldouronate transport system permease protein